MLPPDAITCADFFDAYGPNKDIEESLTQEELLKGLEELKRKTTELQAKLNGTQG